MSGDRNLAVLLVDGDAQFAAQVAAHLAPAGIQAKLASDGYDAVRAVQMRSYDLILLGLQLRDRTGAEVLQLLRLDPNTANTPVHLLAAHGESEMLDSALRIGAQGVFRRDQQPPDAIAFEIVGLLAGPATSSPQPRPTLGNVPSDVDAVAQRFRNPHCGLVADPHPTVPRPSLTHTPPAPTTRPRLGAATQHGSASPHAAVPQPRGTTFHGGPGQHPASKTDLPEGFHARQRFRPSVGAGGAAGAPASATNAGAGSFMTPHGDAPSPSEHAASVTAPPRAPHAPVRPVFSYDTLLNHLVGQAPYLAEAMGLRTDFLCKECGTQFTLRIWPDTERPKGVRGYFFCATCEPQ